jgi:hypothetical protein
MDLTRRGIMAGLLGMVFANVPSLGATGRKKWYITGGRRERQTDCDVDPIICYGKDRVDALMNSGITVWDEEGYLQMRKEIGKEFDTSCKTHRAEPQP